MMITLRSLLLAAFVLSNISWTTSRRQFRHNAHGTRHRRQNAGLYHPASYVVPGGEGTGAWGEWGSVSPCSRTCGGGVANKKRICLQVGPDGQSLCTGGDTKYFSCQIQDCPENAGDFRAEQCSEYDHKPYMGSGITYKWVPYTKAPHPCELNCMPRGERFYYQMKAQVVDGTRCNDESFNVCVAGVCQPVGCDMMLGSNAREDQCRNCRGNGTNCNTVEGLLNTDGLILGYNDILLIPQGATNIVIEEVQASYNYLALRSKAQEYYLNGKYEIISPKSFKIKGTLWHYDRSPQGIAAPDKLRCIGPTTEPLYLSLLFQGDNVNISYKYSVSSALTPPLNQQYNWVHESFSECSATCGGGFQVREVTCRSREKEDTVPDNLCDDGFKPSTNQTCNIEDCPPRWVEGPWSPCSRPCGDGGQRSRQVYCEKIITNRETFRFPSIVEDEECLNPIGPKPKSYETCNQNATCPTWFTGPWKPCNRLCGEGTQTRQVVCHQRIDGFVSLFEDSDCHGEKPIAEKACLLHPCDGIDWVISEWSGCDTCLSTVRTRVAHCATKDHQVIDSNFCSYHPTPVLKEQCDRTKLPSCQVQWYATQWSNCSVECGTGVRTRRVFCGLFDGASVIKVGDERCDEEYKYNDTTTCIVPKEKCPAKWFAGPWSECTKECGGGEQFRRVMCLFGKEDLKCDNETVLPSTQSCNIGSCDKDDLLPIDSKSIPVFDDYDKEDCIEDEEDYPEVGAEAFSTTVQTLFPEFMFPEDLPRPSTTDTSEETGSGFEWIEYNETSTIDNTESTETTVTDFTDVISTTELDETISTESSTIESADYISTEINESETIDGTSSEISVSSTTDNINSISTEIIEFSTADGTTSTITEITEPTIEIYELITKNATPTTSENSVSSTNENGESSTTENAASSTTDSAISHSTESTESISTEIIESSTSDSTSSGITKATNSTTDNEEFSTTESGSTTSENESSTTENILYSTIFSSEFSITDSDISSITKTSSSSITDDDKSSITENESSTTETIESDLSSTTETPVSGTTENSESTIITEIIDSSTIISTLYSTQESLELSTTKITESSITDKDAFSITESDLYTTTENGESSTREHSTSLTTESDQISTSERASSSYTETSELSTTEIGVSSTTEIDTSTIENISKLTTEYDQSSTTNVTPSTSESSISSTTENGQFSTTENAASTKSESDIFSTTESALSSTTDNGASITTENLGKSDSLETLTTEGSTDNSTTESSTNYSTESSTTESEETGTTGSTETTEIGGSSTSPGTTDASTSSEESLTNESSVTETSSTDSSTAESSTNYSTESSTTESEETGTTGSTETTEIGGSSTSPGTTDASTSSEESLTNESSATETTPWDWASTVEVLTNKPHCKPRKTAKCTKSKFGCCPDKRTPAAGPFDEGCPNPETCKDSKFGCCPDGVSPAAGTLGKGCPVSPCNETLYGCCSDNVTAAESNNQEGCPPLPPACKSSKYGCCDDNDAFAKGPYNEGCTETVIYPESTETPTTVVVESCATSEFGCCFDNDTDASGPNGEGCPCSISEFGCCPDGLTTASGDQLEGCLMSCNSSAYGCCPDGKTPAHGPRLEGCCLLHEFGCCPDNYRIAKGPGREGCGCEFAHFGCCPDNITIARGPNMEGCGCEHSRYGCCPDRHTEAQGSEFKGCECHTHQFGCCLDGVTIASGPALEGCRCERSKYGCCGDETTSAKGPNMAGCDCSNSKYGCCPDGKTEAKGNKFLNCSNVPVNKQAACMLRNDTGTCDKYTMHWFYDMEYGGCSQFWYGGCDGNGNRFVNKAECEDVCVHPSPKDSCKLPMVKAICNDYHVRWYYNSDREQCSTFIYGGCLGNSNNFDTKELCQERCEPKKTEDQCNLALERGPCAGNFFRWGFSAERRRCEQFVWGGCGGNHNRYDSEAACQLQCAPHGKPQQACSLPQDAGNCAEVHPVWSFDKTENRCVPFYYSGCGGNDNRFNTQHSCEDTCPSAYVQEICTLPAKIGDCADYSQKWFFDTTIKRCRQFYYGGCGGNENNFLSESECESRCSEKSTYTTTVTPEPLQPLTEPAFNREISEFCLLDIDKGPCTQSLRRWAHDSASSTCVQFEYGGCGGNRNNFHSLEYCQQYCGSTTPPQDICQLPFVSGPCDQSIMQWFYDAAYDSCNQFTYGGCEGNGNRFETQAECDRRCKKEVTTNVIPITASLTTTITMAPSPSTDVIAEACATPVSLAPCGGNVSVYYFDPSTQACLVGDFGACRYPNSHRTEEECQRRCGAFRGLDVCGSPLDTGPCSNAIPKFYWDPLSGRCRGFAYGGCQGGPNRFSTEEECEETCGATRPEARCLEPVSSGTPDCGTPSRRWYYSAVSGECDAFVYSGCGGNDNNFHTYKECTLCKRLPSHISETGNEVLPDCDLNNAECATLRCEYGVQRSRSSSGCERCNCNDHPCANKECSSGERCVATTYRDPITLDILYSSDCGIVNKSGSCPSNAVSVSPIEPRCIHWCNDDADCPAAGKCCEQGCSKLCLEPVVATSPAPTVTTYVPELPQAPSVNSETEAQVRASVGGTATLRCLFHGNPPPKISWKRGQLTIEGDVGRYRLLSDGALEIVSLYRNDSGVYICIADNGLGVARQDINLQVDEMETGNEVLPDCDLNNAECATLRCEYGVQRSRSSSGCERCNCNDHPCANKECSSGERCVATTYRDPITLDILYSSDCGIVNKSGSCPSNAVSVSPIEPRCIHWCNDDADCPAAGKCCEQGCSKLCLEPVVATSPAPTVTTYVPELPQAPSVNSETEAQVRASVGGTATLRCLFHGNPPPKISWKRGQLTIEGDVGRYRLLSDGALEIVSLYRNDSGVYICIADNGLGVARQDINLQVDEMETGNEVLPDCDLNNAECATLRCEYGVQRSRSSSGCERCNCNDHPCANKECSSGERCVATTYRDPITLDILYSSDCGIVNKSGSCPSNAVSVSPIEPRCIHWCNDDADCPAAGKCCEQGCSKLCLEPVVATSPAPTVTTYVPELPQAPSVNSETEAQVRASVGGTATLRCLFHGNPPPKISWKRGQLTIEGDVGRYRLLSDGALEIVSLYRNDSGVYICIADNGLGVARQDINLQVDEMETGNEVLPDCDLNNAECATLRCEYGVQRSRSSSGCERCNCNDHPCANKECSSGERCVATTYRDPITLDILYSSDCGIVNKSGSCPSNAVSVSPIEPRCINWCNDDADCPAAGKCCEQGCNKLCLEPAVATSPAPTVTTYVPELKQGPSANTETEPEMRASLGGTATLRCLFHGNPPPKITWQRRHLMIEGDVGRYRLLSDGALEIVSLYRNDSGVYICIADNGLGVARQQVNLEVDDGVEGPAGIAGLSDAVVVGELGQPLRVRCMAYGYPPPSIYWYHGRKGPMVPFSDVQYEVRDNVLEIKKLSIDTLGEYICLTYNGIGKPVDWSITVKAYRIDDLDDSLFLVVRQNEIVTTPLQPQTEATTTIAPEIEIPVYTAPVTTRIVTERTQLAAGSELSLLCEVDGYPVPDVYWTKDSASISSDDRITVTETRLTVSSVNTNDTGVYGCHAFNAYNSHYSSVQIKVEGLYIPPTCKDNPYFANCNLIVHSKFCVHKYYSNFCCRSCVEAGQLDVRNLQLQDTLYKK